MIKRTIEQYIKKIKKGYPVITITGPRQPGKTTLAKNLFKNKPYITFEDADQKLLALNDPKAFLLKYKNGAIFDEIQRAPEIISYLQKVIDEDPYSCRFILTGSQNFNVMSNISQSLAGRTALITLLPFSTKEIYKKSNLKESFDEVVYKGFYPPIFDRNLEPSYWYSNYFKTYVERDITQLINVKDISLFERFVRLCAARTGCLLNLSSLATDAGISHNTARSWISILEASYIVFLLQPYYGNYSKRLIKTPKLYFYDTGLACYLNSIFDKGTLNIHQYRGNLFENYIIAEKCKENFNNGVLSKIYFWRDKKGVEIDLLEDKGNGIEITEIKSGMTINKDFFKNIKSVSKIEKLNILKTSLVYGGEESSVSNNIEIISWKNIAFKH